MFSTVYYKCPQPCGRVRFASLPLLSFSVRSTELPENLKSTQMSHQTIQTHFKCSQQYTTSVHNPVVGLDFAGLTLLSFSVRVHRAPGKPEIHSDVHQTIQTHFKCSQQCTTSVHNPVVGLDLLRCHFCLFPLGPPSSRKT